MGLGSSWWKPVPFQDTHTSKLVPHPCSFCAVPSTFGTWAVGGEALQLRGSGTWGVACGRGVTVKEKGSAVGTV